MPINFIFFTPTLNRFTECDNLIRSVQSGSLVPDNIIVLDNSAGEYHTELDNIEIHISRENKGVARSFNYALDYVMEEYPDHYVVISNDDLVLRKDTLKKLAKGIKDNPDELIYCSNGLGINAFSLFACKPKRLIDTVGWFETAYTSYLEDCDLAYRMKLINKEICFIEDCYVKEHIGSATLKSFTAEQEARFHDMRRKGMAEYTKKWGALPEQGETYTTPYNSGIDSVRWHKEKFSKESPY